ncbi:MAG: molecular chaperone DnaJ [Legionellales bacterium]|nr:molecular chaperone DnaJ [Legionellales bacterium]
MSKEDYYKTLGVDRSSSDGEIKKAFRRLAMKHHPDRNPNNKAAEKKFKAINEAYGILSDPEKKAAYDQFGHAGVEGAAGGGPGAGGFGGFDFSGDIFGKIFEEFVGGGGGGSPYQEQRGHDLNYHLKISLEEAILGCSKEIQFRALTTCPDCDGKGAKDPNDVVVCKHCNGQGQVRIQQGFLSIQQTCPICKGQGTIVKNPCGTCQGRKRVEKLRKLKVNIPAGIDDGNRIRLSGEGEAGTSGPAGDLYVEVQIQSHAIFKRNGNDLYCESPIQFTEAALGAEITVPTINGKVKITIPKETQTGATFRIRGKGVKGLRSHQAGDLICKVFIETPVKLDDTQKALLEKFAKSVNKSPEKHRPKSDTWFEKVKQFFQKLGT